MGLRNDQHVRYAGAVQLLLLLPIDTRGKLSTRWFSLVKKNVAVLAVIKVIQIFYVRVFCFIFFYHLKPFGLW